ncbi:MAG: hypothetical protein R3E79_16300 [Caldilineaceae bacterium]
MEPTAFAWDIVAKFLPELQIVEQRQIEYTVFSPEGYGDIYQSLHTVRHITTRNQQNAQDSVGHPLQAAVSDMVVKRIKVRKI